MNYYVQKYTKHQLTYFIYYSHQDKFKNLRITRIQEVHQKIATKHV